MIKASIDILPNISRIAFGCLLIEFLMFINLLFVVHVTEWVFYCFSLKNQMSKNRRMVQVCKK